MVNELSIIIPTLNEESYLPKLLQSILKQKFSGKLQIIVVDGQSEDTTIKVVKSFENSFEDLSVVQTTRGISHQRNVGVEHAKYHYLLFIDADIVLAKNFLEKLVKKVKKKDNFIYSFFLWGSEIDILDFFLLIFIYLVFLPIALSQKSTPGGLMLTTKKMHKQVGGFREEIRLAEDLDYGERVTKSGASYRFFLTPFAFHSARRIRKMGRIQFFLLYFKAYLYTRKHGLAALPEKFDYPFGEYKK